MRVKEIRAAGFMQPMSITGPCSHIWESTRRVCGDVIAARAKGIAEAATPEACPGIRPVRTTARCHRSSSPTRKSPRWVGRKPRPERGG